VVDAADDAGSAASVAVVVAPPLGRTCGGRRPGWLSRGAPA